MAVAYLTRVVRFSALHRYFRPDWPEALYLITHKARLGYTLEAPSDFALATRVDALVAGVRAAVSAVAKG